MIVRVHRSERGVSLIEMLIALFILAVVGAAVIAGILVALKSNEMSRTRILSEGLARYELEYVKDVCAENWTVAPWSYTVPGPPAPPWDAAHTSVPSIYNGYSVTVTSALLSGAPYNSDNLTQKISAAVSHQGTPVLDIDTYIVPK